MSACTYSFHSLPQLASYFSPVSACTCESRNHRHTLAHHRTQIWLWYVDICEVILRKINIFRNHNPRVGGSNPSTATVKKPFDIGFFQVKGLSLCAVGNLRIISKTSVLVYFSLLLCANPEAPNLLTQTHYRSTCWCRIDGFWQANQKGKSLPETNSSETADGKGENLDIDRLAALCSVGAAPIPNDLSKEQLKQLLLAISARRRKRLIHLIKNPCKSRVWGSSRLFFVN